MKERHYVGGYWLARRETAEECAQRAVTFFQRLASCGPGLERWYGTTRRRGVEYAQRFEPGRDTLQRLFHQQREQERQDDFGLDVFNGELDEAMSRVSLDCGSGSPWVPSSCLVSLSGEGPVAERLLQASVLTQVLRAMVLAWEPECGVALSDEDRQCLSESSEVGTFVGWVTYFSRRRGEVPPLPAPVRVEPVEDKGTLIVLTPERFSATNPVHLELTHHVTETLARAGLLGPLRPWDV